MLTQVFGLPLHVLLVHAAVVFVPLLALGAAVYALAPSLRDRLRWVVVGLSVIAPLAALFTKVSGDAFFARLQDLQRIGGPLLTQAQRHQTYGTITAWVCGALALVTLAMVYLGTDSGPANRLAAVPAQKRLVMLVLTALMVGLAIVNVVYIYETGDTGAKMVWDNILTE